MGKGDKLGRREADLYDITSMPYHYLCPCTSDFAMNFCQALKAALAATGMSSGQCR